MCHCLQAVLWTNDHSPTALLRSRGTPSVPHGPVLNDSGNPSGGQLASGNPAGRVDYSLTTNSLSSSRKRSPRADGFLLIAARTFSR